MLDTSNFVTKTDLDNAISGLRTKVRKDTEEIVGRVVGELMHDTMQLISERFDRIEARVDRIEVKLAEHDKHFELIEAKLAEHDKRFDQHDKRFDYMDAKIEQVMHRQSATDSQLDEHAIRIGRLEHGRA